MKKYRTCSCNKEDDRVVCIYTGFRFAFQGWLWSSDLFKCPRHKSLIIHGSPPTPLLQEMLEHAQSEYSTFEGFLIMEGTYYRQSGSTGSLTLNQEDQAYVDRYHDLTDYEE